MSMFDYATFDFDLPNGTKLKSLQGVEIQCSIECMMINYSINNYGNFGRINHLIYSPFSLLRNKRISFSIADCSGYILLHFNKLGVIHRFEVYKWDNDLRKSVLDERQSFDWPEDQVKAYNKKALNEIIHLFPSRFKEDVSFFKRFYYFCNEFTFRYAKWWIKDIIWEMGRKKRLAGYTKNSGW